MAKNTDLTLQNQVIYCVYVRNHTEEGTFVSIEKDLKRIKNMGVDIIWFLPIHPIGIEGKKGSLGCPYANKDYRTTNPFYGSMDDFKHLVDEIHALDMKVIIDVVYNHTSPDSNLVKEHPEYFYTKKDGSYGNKIGDWADVIDLDYTNKELWEYQKDSLVMWAQIVDGFRCDVASFVPLDFWKYARKEVEKVNPKCIWLAETVHQSYGNFARLNGIYSARDVEMYEAFDLEYEYDIREVFEKYLEGKTTLSNYLDILNFQEAIYPSNYNKMRYLENHDTKRIMKYISKEVELINFTAMLYFQKGTTQIYAGQEYVNDFTPSLFEKDLINRKTGKNISGLLARLSEIKHSRLDYDDHFSASGDDELDIMVSVRENSKTRKVGVFSLKGNSGDVKVPLEDGPYVNEIDGQPIIVIGGVIHCSGWPIMISGIPVKHILD